MTPTRTMLVAVSGRAGAAVPARLEGFVTGGARVVRRGRRAGAPERLIEEVVTTGITTVIAESLTVFHPSAAKAISIVAALRLAGVAVVTLNDAPVANGDPATLSAVASFLVAVEQRAASRRGRTAIAVARLAGRRLGRPKKPVDLTRARALVEQYGSVRRAAREMNLGASTLRRAIRQAA